MPRLLSLFLVFGTLIYTCNADAVIPSHKLIDFGFGDSTWTSKTGDSFTIGMQLDSLTADIQTPTETHQAQIIIQPTSFSITFHDQKNNAVNGDLSFQEGSWTIGWDQASWGTWTLSSVTPASPPQTTALVSSEVMDKTTVWSTESGGTSFLQITNSQFFVYTLPSEGGFIVKGTVVQEANADIVLTAVGSDDVGRFAETAGTISWQSSTHPVPHWTFASLASATTLLLSSTVPELPPAMYDSLTGLKITVVQAKDSSSFTSEESTGRPEFKGDGTLTPDGQGGYTVQITFRETGQKLTGILSGGTIDWSTGDAWVAMDIIEQDLLGLGGGMYIQTPCDKTIHWTNGTGGIELVNGKIGVVMSLNNTLFWGNVSDDLQTIEWGGLCSWTAENYTIPPVLYDQQTFMKISVAVDGTGNIIASESKRLDFGTAIGFVDVSSAGTTLELTFNGQRTVGHLADDSTDITWEGRSTWVAERYLLAPSWYSDDGITHISCSTVNGIVTVHKTHI